MIRKILEMFTKTEQLEQKVEELEQQVKSLEKDRDLLMKNMTVIAKSVTKMKYKLKELNQQSNDSFGILEKHHEALQLHTHHLEEAQDFFQGMHGRLEAVEGYYFDKPLKEKSVLN